MKLKKRLLSIILTISVVFCSFGFLTCKADELTPSNKCGDNITWEYNETTKVLTLNGYGKMYDYSFMYNPWKNLKFIKVVVSENITSIGNYAFYSCRYVNSVTLPNGITSIGDDAFSWSKLNDINLPNSIKTIGDSAFYCCAITDLSLPTNLISIGESCFERCDKITEITFPNGLTTIGNSAFKGCESIKKIDLPDSVTTIGENAFNCCKNITEVSLPKNLETINNGLFYWCNNLKSIEFPESITTINNDAFTFCDNIKTIFIPKNVNFISTTAFQYCRGLKELNVDEQNAHYTTYDGVLYNKEKTQIICLPLNKTGELNIPDTITAIDDDTIPYANGITSVNIPASVTSISDNALNNLKGISAFKINENNPAYCSYDGVIYNKAQTEIVCFPKSKSGDYQIPNTITAIKDKQFEFCTQLTNIFIPDSVTAIGESAFSNCSGLTEITLPKAVTIINNYTFVECTNLINFVCPENVTSIGKSAFALCSNLKNISLPNGITSLEDRLFWECVNLTSVNIPENVTNISNSSFYKCEKLSEINIPANVTTISTNAFDECCNLKSINVAKGNTNYSSDCGVLLNYSKTKVLCCPSNKTGKYIMPNSVTELEPYCFEYCKNIKQVIVSKNVSVIPEGAFYNCTNLKKITLPDRITNIDYFAFENCESLNDINMPKKLTEIGGAAFYNCSNLTTVVLPEGITRIRNSAFSDCTSLVSINLPNSLTTLENYAFNNCISLLQITIPSNLSQIYYSTFQSCTSLKTVDIPQNISTINWSAFKNCSSLTEINISAGVTSISCNFDGCTSLTNINVDKSNTAYCSEDGVLYNRDKTQLILFPFAKAGEYTLPASVKSLSSTDFRSASLLTSISVEENSTTYTSYDGVLYNKDLTSLIAIPGGKQGNCLIPASTSELPFMMFYKTNITSVEVDSNNMYFSSYDGTLYNKEKTQLLSLPYERKGELKIPATLKEFSCQSLSWHDNIDAITVDENNNNFSAQDGVLFDKNKTELVFCPNGKTGIFIIPEGVKTIKNDAFYYCLKLDEIHLPNSLTTFESGCFPRADESCKTCTIFCNKGSSCEEHLKSTTGTYEYLSTVKGDLTGDETISAADIVKLAKLLISDKPNISTADLNNDNTVDIRDLVSLKKMCSEVSAQ